MDFKRERACNHKNRTQYNVVLNLLYNTISARIIFTSKTEQAVAEWLRGQTSDSK